METDAEQVEELYDFLYRDSNRINSYYAQLFQGKLASFEEMESENDAKEKSYKGDVKLASATIKTSDSKQAQTKRTFDPHDLTSTDILSYLNNNDFIYEDFINAPNGSLVIAKGNLTFIDQFFMGTIIDGYDIAVEAAITEAVADPVALLGMRMLRQIHDRGVLPSFYFLQTDDNYNIFGVVKDSGMEEPITSYYFRHGRQGLGEVYVIGLKEVSVNVKYESMPELVRHFDEFSAALNTMFEPVNGIKVTPLAFFRKFEKKKPAKVVLGSASKKPRY